MSAEEGVQRAHALLEPRLQARPLVGRQDPRHDVEGDQPLGALVLAVDGEGDADAVEERVRLGALARELLGRLLAQPFVVLPAVQARRAGGIEHLIVRRGHSGY